MTSITRQDIRSLRDEAGAAGDLEMYLIAQIALDGSLDHDKLMRIEHGRRDRIITMTQAEARRECETAILDARAARG